MVSKMKVEMRLQGHFNSVHQEAEDSSMSSEAAIYMVRFKSLANIHLLANLFFMTPFLDTSQFLLPPSFIQVWEKPTVSFFT